MADDEVGVIRDALSTHRSMLMGALSGNDDLDIDRAFEIHAGLSRILAHWDEFTANQHRQIMRTVEYVVNDEDEDGNDLTSPDGFRDDLQQLHELKAALGYV
ncbi:MAG TPA: hypothetical protein VIT20_08950 [Propionibacteriaceae bacterium]